MVPGARKTEGAINNGKIIKMKKSKTIPVLFGMIVGVVAMMMLRRCGDGGEVAPSSDTISVGVDTFYAEAKTDTQYVPKPYKVNVPYRIELRANEDSFLLALSNKEAILADREHTIAMLRDHLSTKYYSDTQSIKYGSLVINDTLNRNSIIGRGIRLSQRIPEIKTTYTIRAKQKTIFYLGADVYSNFNNPIWGVGANASLKLKNEKIYSLGAVLPQNNSVVYTFGFKIPIRLNKK